MDCHPLRTRKVAHFGDRPTSAYGAIRVPILNNLIYGGGLWRSFAYGTIDFSDVGGWMVKCADYGLELVIKAGLLETGS